MMKPYIKKTKKSYAHIYEIYANHIKAWVNADDGFNLCYLQYRKRTLIQFQKERFLEGRMYGTPILFPTPNRTKHNRFVFEDQVYSAHMHGVVKKQPFSIESIHVTNDSAELVGSIHLHPDHTMYEIFPFKCYLKVSIRVSQNEITYSYRVENRDKKNMPYGFALHPFFYRDHENYFLQVHAASMMERMPDFLPTGELLPVAGTTMDLNIPKELSKIDFDDVFTDFNRTPQVFLSSDSFLMHIEMSDVFSHTVVYTPMNSDFFCVEPQTCSTDAINLYNAGKKESSGLKVLRPNEWESGSVKFRIML